MIKKLKQWLLIKLLKSQPYLFKCEFCGGEHNTLHPEMPCYSCKPKIQQYLRLQEKLKVKSDSELINRR